MFKNKCYVCGCYDFRADRALSGRLICMSCGNPYGVKKYSKQKLNSRYRFLNTKKLFLIILLILVFIIIIT
tara:strand:- start:1524 stop:1736 length:213 start_codon:yes stop_codon:yes gene_type:complete